MAADDDKEQRTEHASGKRLAKAREEGDLSIARDATMFASLTVGSMLLVSSGIGLRDRLVRLVQGCMLAIATGQTRDILPLVTGPAGLTIAICFAAAAAGAVTMIAQTGGGFWMDRVMPDFSHMFGGGKLTRLFKPETLVDLGISLVKMLTLGWVLWSSIRDAFVTLPSLLQADTAEQLRAIFHPLTASLAKILTGLGLIAGVDFALTRYRYQERMKMTKDEIKREFKDDEGDPMFKGRRKQKHRAMLKGIVNVEVPKADALIVNPTHIAIAIRYRPGEDAAPRVTAKGKGALAETMRDLARQHGVPIVQDIPLARLLYKRVKIGRAVPTETFKAVAAVLAYVYRILGRTPNGQHLNRSAER